MSDENRFEDLIWRIKKIMKERRLTQQELANRAGVHRITIVNLLSGKHVPDLTTVRRVVTALELNREELRNLSLNLPPEMDSRLLENFHHHDQVWQIGKSLEEMTSRFLAAEKEVRDLRAQLESKIRALEALEYEQDFVLATGRSPRVGGAQLKVNPYDEQILRAYKSAKSDIQSKVRVLLDLAPDVSRDEALAQVEKARKNTVSPKPKTNKS